MMLAWLVDGCAPRFRLFFGQRPQDHDLKVAAGRVTWETIVLDLSRAIGSNIA
jgi:hypothetical protein